MSDDSPCVEEWFAEIRQPGSFFAVGIIGCCNYSLGLILIFQNSCIRRHTQMGVDNDPEWVSASDEADSQFRIILRQGAQTNEDSIMVTSQFVSKLE